MAARVSEGDILAEIALERVRQDKKFGLNRNVDYGLCLAFLSEEVGEVAHALNEGMADEEIYKELIQVAACAVFFAEQLGSDKADAERLRS